MKSTCFTLAFIMLTTLSPAQTGQEKMRLDGEALMAKAGRQRTIGKVLKWGGGAVLFGGMMAMLSSTKSEQADAIGVVTALGLGGMITGFSVSAAGRRNERKAASLLQAAGGAYLVPGQHRWIPAVGLTLSLP